MIIRIAIAVLLGSALAAAAHAQSFDGVYKGTRMTTRIVPFQPGLQLECTPVGRRNGIEFRVVGTSITMRYLDFGHVVSGTIAADGNFTLGGLYMQHGGPTAARVNGTWTGRISGSRLTGTIHARAQNGECYGEFSTRK